MKRWLLAAAIAAGTITSVHAATDDKIAVTAVAPTAGEADARAEAGRLLDLMGLDAILNGALTVSLDQQLKDHPELVPFRGVMEDFFHKYMSYASLKDDIVSMYAKEFTAAELRELVAFYSTPTGQKAIAKAPLLMARGAELGRQRVADHLDELKAAIEAEAKRLKAQNTSPAEQAAASTAAAGAGAPPKP